MARPASGGKPRVRGAAPCIIVQIGAAAVHVALMAHRAQKLRVATHVPPILAGPAPPVQGQASSEIGAQVGAVEGCGVSDMDPAAAAAAAATGRLLASSPCCH